MPGVKTGENKRARSLPDTPPRSILRSSRRIIVTRSFRDYPLIPYNAFYAVRHCGGQMNQGSVQRKSGFSFIIRAFRYRNYVLFFSGQGISIIGTWMQQIAINWSAVTKPVLWINSQFGYGGKMYGADSTGTCETDQITGYGYLDVLASPIARDDVWSLFVG